MTTPGGYAVIDTETTGFAPWDRVIEIGVVLLDLGLGRERTWDTLINPGRANLGPVHVHRIRPADVAAAPSFAGIAQELVTLLRGRIIVGHNVTFDTRMLNQEFQRLQLGEPLAEEFTLDTLALARNLALSPDGCFTLDHLRQVFGLRLDDAHAALADADAAATVFELAARAFARKLGAADRLTEIWASVHAAAAAAVWPSVVYPATPPLSRAQRNSATT